MRHQQQSALPRGPAAIEVTRQPRYPFHIQVVCGLVQSDDVPITNQEFREGEASALSPAQRLYRRFPRDGGQQPIQHFANPRVAEDFVMLRACQQHRLHRVGAAQSVLLPQQGDS